ncbi:MULTISPECIES: MBL fold metallo-hydrolase [unclassified Desulfovibrio]|uniref:MBL fold metallo-hydrolase n=1 Tax=unclassified Desulfovibrio TaxID=2593640 RepID=UPI000F6009BB|nr:MULTISPECIES: MBL fold metallo-hydrolase [unclassified Desulfovibrio]RRD69336.1 MBL fold metallo-hydrolase [Desulfovibrio sp. OH1209_COT-279]RRD86051.1 MBL fold metallo-hydrolase [Desulfovibrio sp. OH1186_COT-070]
MSAPSVRGFFDPATATWTYVVWSETDAQRRCAVIDSVLDYDAASGKTSTASADLVADFVREKNLTLEWILETHIHADHITAASYLKEKLGGKIAASCHMREIIATWTPLFQNGADTTGEEFDHLFADDEKFTIADLQARIIHTPGHTPADTCYIVGDAVFAGDAIFLPDVGSGRCDFPGGSAGDSYASSRTLFALPDAYRIYVGHDYPPEGTRGPLCMSTVGEQKKDNVRLNLTVDRESFVARRTADDTGKDVPPLLLPSLQANMRAGTFGTATNGIRYVKIPVNAL